MKPYTRAEAEADLIAALETGELDDAYAAASVLDRMDPGPAPSLGGAALWYAEHLIPVFPLMPGSKVPWAGGHGLKDATITRETIRSWWTAHPDSNIGLATGHLFDVIDIDGVPGNVTLARDLLDAPTPADPYHGISGVVGVVSTPRPGGRHLYLTPPRSWGNAAGMDGIDFRGRGGYVLAPPSKLDDRPGQHPGTYVWVRALAVEP